MIKTKPVSKLEKNDLLKRKSNNELIAISDILVEDEQGGNYYFKNCGYVRQKGLRNFFESTESGIVVYN